MWPRRSFPAAAPTHPAVFFGRQVVTHGELRAAACGWDGCLRAQGTCLRRPRRAVRRERPLLRRRLSGHDPRRPLRRPLSGRLQRGDVPADRRLDRHEVHPRLRPISRIAFSPGRTGWAWKSWRKRPSRPARRSPEAPPVEVDPRRHLAAIMFTSGSTGDVKGVMVTHHNILVNTAGHPRLHRHRRGRPRDDRPAVLLLLSERRFCTRT